MGYLTGEIMIQVLRQIKRTITAGLLELSSISRTQEIPGEKEDGLIHETT